MDSKDNKDNKTGAAKQPIPAKPAPSTRVGNLHLPTYVVAGDITPQEGAKIALDLDTHVVRGTIDGASTAGKVVLNDTNTTRKGKK